MSYIQGIVKVVLFHSSENSFTIIKIKVTDSKENLSLFAYDDYDYVTVTGYFPKPIRGEEMRFYGEFIDHPKYGTQYKVQNFETVSDTSISGLIEYLSSDLFHGVGIKTAERVVNELGKNTIEAIMNDKHVLDDVSHISEKQRDTIYEGVIKNKASEQTLIKLYSYNLTPKMAMKIYKHYQNEAIAIIEQNPYQLMYDIEGIGFERADQIAKELDIKDDDPMRVKAMIVYLYQIMGNNYGHSFLQREQLIEYLLGQLNKKEQLVDEDDVEILLDEMITDRVFYEEDERIQFYGVHYAEQHIVKSVKRLMEETINTPEFKQIEDMIDLYESLHDITYTKSQKKAIHEAMKEPMFILTGGPGTGKTTVINGLVFVYCKVHQIPISYDNPMFEIKLIAPTGRAAKRMNETTKVHAQTIHRFLGYDYEGNFSHNKDNPVSADVIIIDEASMIDVYLASQLFQAIQVGTKVVIVGDQHQLPSVGVGQVLTDFIKSDMINSIELQTIHRQAKDSHIIDLAHNVKQNKVPYDILDVYSDRYFVEESTQNYQARLKKIIDYLLNNNYSLLDDIQVLIPMYRGQTGIDATNDFIQKNYNEETKKSIKHGNRTFQIGDKVIQLVNQLEDNIMNGDQGIVIGIPDDKTLVIEFDEEQVTYKTGDLINIKHAYAMSIHKSQGSEYPVVIMPVFRSYSIMLRRKLLYTAITRAKEKLILIGDLKAFTYGVERMEAPRQSKLSELLVSTILSSDKEEENSLDDKLIIDDPDIPFDTLGEELENKTPYSFMNTKPK